MPVSIRPLSLRRYRKPPHPILPTLIDKAENEQLTWLTRKDAVLVEMRELLAEIDSSEVRKAAIATWLGELDLFVESNYSGPLAKK